MDPRNVMRAFGLGLVSAALLLLASPSTAFAQVGGTPPENFTATNPGDGALSVNVGSGAAPIPIVIDPSAPVWTKTITVPLPLQPGDIITVWEFISFDPSPFLLTDWHEEVVPNPADPFDIGGSLSWLGGTTNLPSDPPTIAGGSIDFFLLSPEPTPIPLFEIHKDLIYNGPILSGGGTVGFTIIEFPTFTTPEPTGLSLLAMAFVGLAWARRARA